MTKVMMLHECSDNCRTAARMSKYREFESKINEIRFEQNMTVKTLCLLADVHPTTFSVLANGTRSPLDSNGKVTEPAKRICDVLGCDFTEAFPRYFCKVTPDRELLPDQILDCIGLGDGEQSGEDYADQRDRDFIMAKALSQLTSRQQLVFNWYVVGGFSYEKIGKVFGVTGSNIRAIVRRVIHKLRHPHRGLQELY